MGRHRDNPDRPDPTYDAGYKKPPKPSQFKPGHKGYGPRRKKQADFHEMLAKALNRNATVTVKGEQKTMTAMEVMANQLVSQLATNPAKFMKVYWSLIQAALTSQDLKSGTVGNGDDFLAEFRLKIEKMAENLRLADMSDDKLTIEPDKSET